MSTLYARIACSALQQGLGQRFASSHLRSSLRSTPLVQRAGIFKAGVPLRQTAAVATMAPIQLYSMATPNGQKIGVVLEELGIPYEAHLVHIGKGEQFKPEFLAINPNGKIPAIVDPEGADGAPLKLFESGAIMMYLAEKYGKLLPKDTAGKWEAIQWTFFQVGGVGPMFGQYGHFTGAKANGSCTDPYPLERYKKESYRLVGVLETALTGKEYLAGGEFSIADIANFTWVRGSATRGALSLEDYPNVSAWVDRIWARPAVQKGITVCQT